MYIKKPNILIGDIIKSEFDVITLVCKDEGEEIYGSLICQIGHSCRDIPYTINEGEEYELLYRKELK